MTSFPTSLFPPSRLLPLVLSCNSVSPTEERGGQGFRFISENPFPPSGAGIFLNPWMLGMIAFNVNITLTENKVKSVPVENYQGMSSPRDGKNL